MTDARDFLSEIARLKAELVDARANDIRTKVCMGVGDGSGSLFVYGDYVSIKSAQAGVIERGELAKKCADLQAELAAAEQVTRKTLQSIPVAMDAAVAGACKLLKQFFDGENTSESYEAWKQSARAYIAKHSAFAERHASAVDAAVAEERAKLFDILIEARSGLCAYTGGERGACEFTIAKIDAAIRARGTEGGR